MDRPHSAEVLQVYSPATGQRVGSTPLTDATDVDTAVRSAKAAFDSGVWRNKSPEERAAVVAKVADLIDERSAQIADVVSAEIGAPTLAVATLHQLPATGILRECAKPGMPDDPEAQLGPLITEKQRTKVEDYIRQGKKAGATAVLDSVRPDGLESGYYLSPTIFTGVTNDMTIVREEIFGPVIAVIAVIDYETEEEAIAIANDSEYGLAGTVWTADVEHGLAIAAQIRTGTYGVNWYTIDPGSPFGGYKNSGIGRENGPEGLESYLEHKTVALPMGYDPSA